MTTVGIVAPGAMGAALGASLRAGGATVVTTLAGRSPATARPAYQCVGISQAGGEAAQVHDGIRSTALPDGTYSCVDLTSGVDRRLC